MQSRLPKQSVPWPRGDELLRILTPGSRTAATGRLVAASLCKTRRRCTEAARAHHRPDVEWLQVGKNFSVSAGIKSTIYGTLAGRFMKIGFRSLLFITLLTPGAALAQGRASEFRINKITKSLISTPQYQYNGAEQYQANQRQRWLEVEVEFTATPEWTDELTFKYYILFNGKLLTGEVTHTNIPAGRDDRSVMYLPPRTLERFANNRPITANMFQNIAVQIVQQGAVKDELSLTRAPAQWFTTIPQISGYVLNKNETPFAPLYWDRYERIKTTVH
jgi:hypothetical protein